MKRISISKILIAIALVLLLTVLAIAMATDVIVTSRVSSTASFHELQGIQGADTTQNVAQQKKAKQEGKSEEAKELETIRASKVQHFQVISAAQNTQNRYYDAQEKGNDTTALRGELESRIPQARGSLTEMKTLTDREIEILQAIGGDESAISIVRSFYKAMETAVDTLQLDELTDEQVMARERDIQIEGRGGIHTARLMSDRFVADDMEAGEKQTLDEDVVKPGEQNVKSLGDVLTQMPSIIFGAVAGMAEGLNLFGGAMDRYSDYGQMAHDLVYNQGMFSRSNMNAFQNRLDSIGAGVQQFLGEYSPFVESVGRGIGRPGRSNPLGYGSNVVIRFQDREGRYYIVHEEEDQGMRVVIDKNMTRWNSAEDEIRTLIIFDYNDQSVETAVRAIGEVAPGFDNYVRQSRMVYIRKAYLLPYRNGYVIEISFQNANGQQLNFYQAADPYANPIRINRRTSRLDFQIVQTITVVNPPKDTTVVRTYFNDETPPAPAPREDGAGSSGRTEERTVTAPTETQRPAAGTTTSQTVSRRGSINPPNEGVEVLAALDADQATKEYIISDHERAVEHFNSGNYAMALRMFARNAERAPGNYLDAYWAALSAHNANNEREVKRWLDRCLEIKGDYMPALEMKRALRL